MRHPYGAQISHKTQEDNGKDFHPIPPAGKKINPICQKGSRKSKQKLFIALFSPSLL